MKSIWTFLLVVSVVLLLSAQGQQTENDVLWWDDSLVIKIY